MRKLSALATSVVFAACVSAEGQTSPTFTRSSGGSIQTVLGPGFVVNKNSSLQREWITLHDPAVPADVRETVGVTTVYVNERGTGHYEYSSSVKLVPAADLTAIEMRFLLFDLWGNHVRSLSLEEVEDVPAGQDHLLTGRWRAWQENEVSSYYASIGYIARVRTKDGRVVASDPTPVLEEARKFSKKFTPADLEPRPEQHPPGRP